MFSRKSHADVRKSTQKALDPKRDVLTRLKHLRALLDLVDGSDLKQFFDNNYSQIYFIFYENFITLENSLKQKGNKSQREELDSILFLFEKILQLLPERIFYRWHFRSIGSILKKLLHTGNSLKLRCEGMRLFLLWLQALQSNCGEEQVLLFACLVPGFPPLPSPRGPCTLDSLLSPPAPPDAKVFPEEITPLVPAVPGEKPAEEQTCYFLQLLLKYMVTQAASLEWKNKENQDTGFKFLFALFRKYYLPHLFPSFTRLTNLYKPVLDIPDVRPRPVYVAATRNNESVYCTKIPYMAARVVFIKWLVTFFLEKKYLTAAQNTKNGGEMLPKIIQTAAVGQEKGAEPEGSAAAAGEQERGHCSSSSSSSLGDRRLSSCSLCSVEEQHRSVYQMVQGILLSTRGYVNFVHEVFRQAFLLPPSDISATRKVVKVYQKWILQEKPVFMEEPDKREEESQDAAAPLEDSSVQTDGKHLSSEPCGHKRSSSWGRTYSFSSAVSRGCVLEDEDRDVKAGAQAALQVFLTNSANVFLLEPCTEVPVLLKEQVDACKAVLSIFRRMIMELSMNRKTWEQMLQVLLRITEAVMQKPKEGQTKDTFAQSMAGLLFRTLLVAWIRGSLSVFISRELWDELLSVLSALTHWEELVTEWASIMDSLTAVLARTVYGVEMTNLPLDKLSEQKEKKQRGKGGVLEPQKTAVVGRSFSLSWKSHPEVVEPMRFRSATTSGAPGVEKARSIVRQRATAKRSQSISNCVHLYEALPTTKSVPLLLHTVSSLFPGISYTSCSHRLSEVEESQQLENSEGAEAAGPFADQEQQLTRSSSTSDIADQIPSEFFQGKTAGNSASDSRSLQENRGCAKEQEAEQVPMWRSSSTAELGDARADSQGCYRDREKSESLSSDTSLGCATDVDAALVAWQAAEDEPEAGTGVDPAAPRWLQLSPSQEPANLTDSSEFLADDCSIIAGGSLVGWHPDSAAVLWRRILGILGDVNNIQSPKIHAKVFGYLYELWYKLAKIRDNLAISVDNQSTPSPPVLIPPLRIFASWLFKAATLPSEYKEGKLQAFRLLCAMMSRRQDLLPNSDFLVHFYLVLRLGLTSEDQDILNTVIKHCPPWFFFLGLPGFTMLIGDFLGAAARVLSTDTPEAPRCEAHTILGALVCFPNTYQGIPWVGPVSEGSESITGSADMKYCLINILLKNATEEPSEAARCIAICGLGVWICEELTQRSSHPHVKRAINVIGVTLKFSNKLVAHVACDVLQLLVSYWQKLQEYESSLCRKITEILVATIAFLLPGAEHSSLEADKKFIVSLLLCLLDWCMALPMKMLLEPVSAAAVEDQHASRAPLLDYIYRVLHCCVNGSSTYSQQSHYVLSLADLSCSDYDPFLPLGNVRSSSEPAQCPSSTDLGNLLTVAEEKRRRNLELIPLTARMVMTHLVNHLSHYPLSGGPAILHSLLSENHDNSYVESSELCSEVFRSPNLQLFVFNDSTLISYLQIPAEHRPGAEPAAAPSDVRVIVRDISGKYSWDGHVLYGPLEGRPPQCGTATVTGEARQLGLCQDTFTGEARRLGPCQDSEVQQLGLCQDGFTGEARQLGLCQDGFIGEARQLGPCKESFAGEARQLGPSQDGFTGEAQQLGLCQDGFTGEVRQLGLCQDGFTGEVRQLGLCQDGFTGEARQLGPSQDSDTRQLGPSQNTFTGEAWQPGPSQDSDTRQLGPCQDGAEEGEDALDQLLERIGSSSPECLPHPQRRLNEPAPPPRGLSAEQERALSEALLRQSARERDFVLSCGSRRRLSLACQQPPPPAQPQASFYFCRLLLDDLGMNSWDRRKSFHLLKKNSKLLRELKNLDSRQCRETHKIAVFYIAEGQEDKCSILANARGSQAYEDFVAGLGWEVDLSTHCGFMGGLQRNGSTGQTAPYYATSTVEIIFHVSTRMPSDSDDSLTKKLRHLGNDEVHIVWSEHTRNYRRGIIPTDFGDVLIVIYPMKNHMFFIEIMKKPEVPFFGPLFDGAIVTAKLLPSLVCATCINASRAVKSLIPLYQSFYEERALYLEAIIQNHKEVMTFEDFAAQVFSPSPSYSLGGTD
ncbi:ral GTPase-activating protein subunit alpha-2 isoform X2 [Poecile atricapillus]|uniref:ral GTPase-activating protein subunit alpha-2 isoform X2 n=1 Tax=Poecile atricapillus TaxID=48891 RepID=UPI002739A15D|nr:ral GTPase-activating protein subunit alpha-2 isoform X2 [Poecile atricapillus]